MDERFKLHRFYSTRIAVLIGAVLMGGWFYYDLFVNGTIRWDFFVVLSAMAVSKIAAMIYYRYTN